MPQLAEAKRSIGVNCDVLFRMNYCLDSGSFFGCHQPLPKAAGRTCRWPLCEMIRDVSTSVPVQKIYIYTRTFRVFPGPTVLLLPPMTAP
jgi:hypothetical protein